ncbi:50S ribosomal protein L17 [Exiguobacterium sp. Leaf187]|jgi:large subunit ribosomal protein L17|uniref:Large ribosomal subunit protein bL17 n=4 Tax=Exiguobacterium TaxID=33986 RepID=A0A653IH05_9BACL|nr:MULTISPECIES: 50S ribosomal protein L17 [Exiguobacterium]AHA28474.1 50S ribosomal protein L17 [Exiguobacterium sp. MH3]AOS99295.1 50S ribosomal protein L17 [Exiguobacterium sp. U13-1]ASI34156.1 50S ribosomal protein L17 [Exiguobacterium sp. N4-1P]ASI37148.1 50S ribosomal protein L17 [Exiguobacterium sp. N4-1P]EZP58278.1 50S ribosomal protein L17 [Exiguobacterium sp. RIT341]
MAYSKLGRTSSQRKALLRDLATDLIINERIQTTEQKAKELRPVVEKLITLGKRGDLHARRQVASFVRREAAGQNAEGKAQDAIQKLFADVAPRFAERQGGYTRIMKMGPRRGDGAEMVIIELV